MTSLSHPFFAGAKIEDVHYTDDLERLQKLFIDNKLNINAVMLAAVKKKINDDFEKYLEDTYGSEAKPAMKEAILRKAGAELENNSK